MNGGGVERMVLTPHGLQWRDFGGDGGGGEYRGHSAGGEDSGGRMK